MNVIQCYAPTNDSQVKDKDQFYNRLQNIVENFPDKDINIVMGDFNAKVGSDNTGYEQVMGIHGLREMNENGERFADFCALNDLTIGWYHLSPQENSQEHMDITRPCNRKSD